MSPSPTTKDPIAKAYMPWGISIQEAFDLIFYPPVTLKYPIEFYFSSLRTLTQHCKKVMPKGIFRRHMISKENP
jgi:hypothetical protein